MPPSSTAADKLPTEVTPTSFPPSSFPPSSFPPSSFPPHTATHTAPPPSPPPSPTSANKIPLNPSSSSPHPSPPLSPSSTHASASASASASATATAATANTTATANATANANANANATATAADAAAAVAAAAAASPTTSSSSIVCSNCQKPYTPPDTQPVNLLCCRKCGTYVQGHSALEVHFRLSHRTSHTFHCCPTCLPLLAIPGQDDSASIVITPPVVVTPPVSTTASVLPVSSPARMYHRDNNPQHSDPAAFAAAAAAAHAVANSDMPSAPHSHLVAPSALAPSPSLPVPGPSSSSQFPLPLAVDHAQTAFSAPPQHNHLFPADRSDPSQHPLALGQNPNVFSIQPDDPSHHSAQPNHQSLPHSQSQPLPTPPSHHNVPQSSQQQQQTANRKGKRPSVSPVTRPHRPPNSTIPAQTSPHLPVGIVQQDTNSYARMAAPIQQGPPGSHDPRNESAMRSESLYPHLGTRQNHPAQQHPQIIGAEHSHAQQQQHMAAQAQQPQPHHPGTMRTATGTFNGSHMPDARVQAGATRFGFEDDNRRRQGVQQGAAGHNAAVMVPFPENYMSQPQDGLNDGRPRSMAISEPTSQHQAQQARFEGDNGALGAPNMAYDIKDSDIDHKRIGNNGVEAADAVLASGVVDASGLNRTGNVVASRTTPRIGTDGRPILGPGVFIHGTIEKRVTCKSCGLLFGDAGSLNRHAARAHRISTGKGPVYCSQCNASLKNEQNLRRHIAVCHSGEQENRCDMCSASFSSRGSLRIHQQQVHSQVAGPKDGRNGRGGRGGGLGRGGRVGSGINKSSKSDKSYVCEICNDTFKWKGNLKRHRELRHLQLRPFLCQICNASFGTKSNMRVHLITHNTASQQK